MTPIKRKGGPDTGTHPRSPKARASTVDDRLSKKRKTSQTIQSSETSVAQPRADDRSPKLKNPSSTLSAPWAEEPSFPRGGASILTPLEHKQIQIEATRDVLFEQQSSKKTKPVLDEDVENGDPDVAETSKLSKGKRKGKGKPKNQAGKGKVTTEAQDHGIKIEGLSYRRIVPGSVILGQVSRISSNDVAVALPNNLTGYVPLTSISGRVTERLETLVAEIDAGNTEDGLVEEKDVNLGSFLYLGQYLRAYVSSTGESAAGKIKKHIELTLDPRRANAGLKKSDLVVNSMVQACVKSVEDHGLVMEVALEEESVRGFMSSKEVGDDVDQARIEEGAVFLCIILGHNSDGNVVKLSADPRRIGNVKKSNYLTDAPTIDSFMPGTAVELLISQVTPSGIAGKVMGLVDVTADLVHSGAGPHGKDLEKKHQIGNKVKGRIVCTFPNTEPKKLGVSLLDHVLALRPQKVENSEGRGTEGPVTALPLSTIVDKAKIVKVEQGVGLFVDVGITGTRGFVHVSRITDGKIETLSESTGPYKVGSIHKARILDYNSMDNLYIVSMERKIIDQPFLRFEDIQVGEVVKGKVEKLIINAAGVGGVLVTLADGITGLVPEMHMADIHLQHPEKKFKEGLSVRARVLSVNPERRQARLTLKKTLVNSDAFIWKSYADISPGVHSLGTLVNVLPSGAVVQFFGSVRGFLPVSEMSEAYIQDPKQHFRNGQVVNVHAISVDRDEGKLIVSCKDQVEFSAAQQIALKNLQVGDIVSGIVLEKSTDDIKIELQDSGLTARISLGHLADGSEHKIATAMEKIRLGQTLHDLLVLEKLESKHLITLTNKATLIKAAKEGKLLKSFEELTEGLKVDGFVKNIIPTGIFVQFAGGLTGLLPRKQLLEEPSAIPDFGMRRYQTISAVIMKVDHDQQRFLLTMKDSNAKPKEQSTAMAQTKVLDRAISNPVDEESQTIDDFTIGKLTKAKIVSVKDTQMNVQLADGIQGRIDVSEVFDSWADIKDRKRPLRSFTTKQILPVRILGVHDARNHRFLPITHSGRTPVFELTAKASHQNGEGLSVLGLDQIKVGSSWLAFVNNIAADCLWVNLSPNVRGRIRITDVSDDVSLLQDLEKNFPLGSALRVHVTAVDVASNRLDLSARSGVSTAQLSLKDLSPGMILPGRVTKVTERQLMVQLNDTISGPVHLTELADDYSQANPTTFQKNQAVRVCVTDLDVPNKKIVLSARPSKVLSSSLPVRDPEIRSISLLKVNDVVRGFVKNVADNGLFVTLGTNVTAYIRVSDLSDSFLKDWKSSFEIDQLVEGKIVHVDPLLNHVQLSLKKSILDKTYVAPITFDDIKAGQIVTGKVRKVEDFGVFIVVDNSSNVSGLCHRSEMAEQRVEDVKRLYNEGDAVKAKVLKVDREKRRINFGLKASFFQDDLMQGEEDSDDVEAEGMDGVRLDADDQSERDDEDAEMDNGVDLDDVLDAGSELDVADTQMGESGGDTDKPKLKTGDTGLSTGGFDWTGGLGEETSFSVKSRGEPDTVQKKKKRKSEIQTDRTADLDAQGPRSVADFERLLLGQPDSSYLWLSYMAFELQLSEVAKAREVAERAVRTISMREETEKMNVWIAMLNLENTYGDAESVEEVFKRACQYNDAQEIHERLTSILIQSGKHEVRRALIICIVRANEERIFTESRRPLPVHDQEILSRPQGVAELCDVPLRRGQYTRLRTRSAPSRHAISPQVRPSGFDFQICAAGIPVAERRSRTRPHHLRRTPKHLPETVGFMERATRSGDQTRRERTSAPAVRASDVRQPEDQEGKVLLQEVVGV